MRAKALQVLVFSGLMLACRFPAPCLAAQEAPGSVSARLLHGIIADYDAELRTPGGRVDVPAMVRRLKELGVNTYFWLIWHAPTDWEDLKLFLPEAQKARINVWVYLVPPSETPPYSEPFKRDYRRWAQEIARLSLKQPSLTAWVIDDFYQNHRFFTPQYVAEMQRAAKRIKPQLAFLPLMYFRQITPHFTERYRKVIDGVVVAYPQNEKDIEQAWAVLNDATSGAPVELTFPWETPSKAGDFIAIRQTAVVLPATRYTVEFNERDDFTGPTSGYHFKQLLLDGRVLWERDVAGGLAHLQRVVVDVTEAVRGKSRVEIAFRLFDRKGVSNFGVNWQLRNLCAEGIKPAGSLCSPQAWKVTKRGHFEATLRRSVPQPRLRFHLPFIVMTAGSASQFRKRHGDPATPERIAQWVRMCLNLHARNKCDGVVTYCLNKAPSSRTFPLVKKLFRDFISHRKTNRPGSCR